MKAGKAKRQKRAASVVAAVLYLCGASAALQTPAVPQPPAVAGFATASMRRILVSIPDRKLALLQDGKVVRMYRVAVGKRTTPSPPGEFQIVTRVTNPTYFHNGIVIPPGANNPVGTRWMGLSVKRYGIHGTNHPDSIGQASSSGCIRMGRRDLEELFALVEVGDTVQILDERDEQIAAVFHQDDDSAAMANGIATTPEVPAETVTPIVAPASAGGGQ